MTAHASVILRGTRAPAPGRSRLPSGDLRAPGRAPADEPRPSIAERATGPLDFYGDRTDLPCQQDPEQARWWFAPEEEPGLPKLGEEHADAAQRLCGPCPVLLKCRMYAIQTGQQWGIWGGVRFARIPANTRAALLRETRQLLNAKRRPA